VRDRQYAETKSTSCLKLYEEVKEQRDQIAELGRRETMSPTVERPLGPQSEGRARAADAQLEVITVAAKISDSGIEKARAELPPSCWMAEPSEGPVLGRVAAPQRSGGAERRRSRRARRAGAQSKARVGGTGDLEHG